VNWPEWRASSVIASTLIRAKWWETGWLPESAMQVVSGSRTVLLDGVMWPTFLRWDAAVYGRMV
jgi:hypothetical protein